MSRAVLVVGGAGYIGAHTCKALAEADFLPITFDNLTTGHRDFVKWGPLHEGDIRDDAHVARVVRDNAVDAIVHFAACAYVGESVVDPAKYYENNVAGSLSLLKGVSEGGCRRIVFSSTCAVYGEPDTIPISEGTERRPINPYGRSKLMVEHIIGDYVAAYGLAAVVLRYFNACGADPAASIGELRDPETHLIPRAIMRLLGHVDDFTVFGSDYPTEDGTAVRDYIHVTDLADAHVKAVQHLLGGAKGGTFNLGTGHGYSVKQVLTEIARRTGRLLPEAIGARRPGDPANLIADPALAMRTLGFQANHSSLEHIVDTAWNWHQKAHPQIAGDEAT